MKPPASIRVQLCGTLVVEIDGRQLAGALGGRQPRLLFAYLVRHRQRPVRRDELVDVLWPDAPPASPTDVINTLVSRLRKGLGDGMIEGRYELTLELGADAWVDVEIAFHAIGRAERALEQAQWEEAASAAELALSVVQQGFLAGIDVPWVVEERGRLDELALRGLECLAASGLGVGGSRLSVSERSARALIARAPYRETGYRYMMQALAERGRVAEALQVFERVRRLLSDELGVAPGAGLRSLHEQLLTRQHLAPRTERDDPLAVGPTMDTVLISDLIGDADDERCRLHARLLRGAVAAHGGREVIEVADGLAAVFRTARASLRCAVWMQQAAAREAHRRPESALRMRVAVHTGEAEIAHRLCARAAAGQILASAPVRSAAGAEHRFSDIGASAHEVLWEPAAERPFAVPTILASRPREVFVGRASDMDRLWEHYEQARGGSLRVVLLSGEPGIGKTRMAGELARRAHAEGAVLLYGRCDEEPLVPHQPFVEALGHYVGACPLEDLAGQIGPGSGELRRIVPELAQRLPDLPQPLAGDPEGERYRFFEAVTALLREAAQTRPLVLVLDDLHWADKPTLLLLKHLVRNAQSAPLLVVGTYRDSEVQADHPLSQLLADLSAQHSIERHSLAALDRAAVAQLVTSHAGHDVPELNALIFEETDGNPFFVVEMLRHLAESNLDYGERAGRSIPEGVKAVIARRIARLGRPAHRVLSTAAIMGRDFEVAVLQHLSEIDEEELVDALEQAVRARLVEEVAHGLGRYTFSHALIRETIYGELTAARRALLHRRVATALEQTHAADLDRHGAELAHHFAHAGTVADLDRAIEYSAKAGRRATSQLAYEQAAEHYRLAVSLIDLIDSHSRQALRCDLVIAQGEAERRAGDPGYRKTLLEGARLAGELGDAERLTRAALANNRGFFSAAAGVDRDRVEVLNAALAAHGPSETPSHASLLAHLALELVADPDWTHRASLSDKALAMARRVGDQRSIVRALNYRYLTLWGPRTLPERLANLSEANDLVVQLDDPVLAALAAGLGAHVAMEAGELRLADDRLERAVKLADQIGQPTITWYIAITCAKRSSISGAPARAEQLARVAFDAGRRAGQADAFAWYANQLAVARFLGGTLGGGQPNLLKAAEVGVPYDSRGEPLGSHSVPLLVEAVHIVTLCEVGRTEAARPRFDALMAGELADLPHDWTALAIPALASVACHHLEDRARAARLYAMLEPHAEQYVDNGPSWFGATAHHMALLAATLGRLDDSHAHFEAAHDAYVTLRSSPWLVRLQLDWARMLCARRDAYDGGRVEQLLIEALATAQTLGSTGIERKAALLLQELRAATS